MGLRHHMVSIGQFPPMMASRRRGRAPVGLLLTAAIALVTFVTTTLVHEPTSILTLLVIVLVSVGLDVGWERRRTRRSVGPSEARPETVDT